MSYRYRVVRDMSLVLLEDEVTEYLNDGWSTAGGISFDGDNYIQAVQVKWEPIFEDDDEEDDW